MDSFHYAIAPEIFQDHPEYCRGIVVFHKLDNTRPSQELTTLLRTSEASLRQRVTGNPAEHPHITAWRNAYRSFGAKPAEHRSSIEALSRRVLKPDSLPDINPLVDIGNLLSLRYLLPAGVHPIGKQSSNVLLRKANDADCFLADADKEPEVPTVGEVVLAAGNRVLTRRWTWRQAADTRTLPETDFVFFDIDGLPPVNQADVEYAIQDVVELVQRFCNGQLLGSAILTAQQPTLNFSIN